MLNNLSWFPFCLLVISLFQENILEKDLSKLAVFTEMHLSTQTESTKKF